jgi:hypothetical protein
MKKYVNGKAVEMTAEEIAEMREQAAITEAQEKSRPLTEAEVSRMLITQQVNTLPVDDNTALRMREFYPEWAPGTEYTTEAGRPVGYKVQRNGRLWKLKQEHTSLAHWEPGATGTESLWEEVNETHSGELTDPIPYNGNMALKAGLYYIQNSVIYHCIRDTVNPVYNPLAELVGLYVEEV